MRRRFLTNISFNALQLLLNQGLSLVVFIILAKQLSKHNFGALNLSLALLLTTFAILSFGIDQVLVQKIAAGSSVNEWSPVALFHNIFSGLLFYIILFLVSYFSGAITSTVLLLGTGKLLISLAAPCKGVMNGRQEFKPLFFMSTVSNCCRVAGLGYLIAIGTLSLKNTCLLFLFSDFAELNACVFLFYRQGYFFSLSKNTLQRYRKLIKEALPQLGTVICAAAMSRFDWIFIGLFLSEAKLAEYGFAYKVFELAQFPMLVIAPMLVPLFTKYFQRKEGFRPFVPLFKIEMLIASASVLVLNLVWEPLANLITGGKYGTTNNLTFLLLSVGLPLLYFNNFLWSIHFAKRRLKMIFSIFLATLIINIIFLCVLVPYWGNEGAALAYTVSILFQTLLYYRKEKKLEGISWNPLYYCLSAALFGLAVSRLIASPVIGTAASIAGYLAALLLANQLAVPYSIYLRKIRYPKATFLAVFRIK